MFHASRHSFQSYENNFSTFSVYAFSLLRVYTYCFILCPCGPLTIFYLFLLKSNPFVILFSLTLIPKSWVILLLFYLNQDHPLCYP